MYRQIVTKDHIRELTVDDQFKESEEHVTMMISQFLKDTGKMPVKLFIAKDSDYSSLYFYAGILYDLECFLVNKDHSWLE